MSEVVRAIFSIPQPFGMIVVIVLIGSVAGVLSTIATQIRKYGCHRQDVDFKRELVDRGLSAEEIERIVTSRSTSGSEKPTTVHVGSYVAGRDS